jgi:hypothetical protein
MDSRPSEGLGVSSACAWGGGGGEGGVGMGWGGREKGGRAGHIQQSRSVLTDEGARAKGQHAGAYTRGVSVAPKQDIHVQESGCYRWLQVEGRMAE